MLNSSRQSPGRFWEGVLMKKPSFRGLELAHGVLRDKSNKDATVRICRLGCGQVDECAAKPQQPIGSAASNPPTPKPADPYSGIFI
jgi:hypothetical protein